jgi:hypothetical protein
VQYVLMVTALPISDHRYMLKSGPVTLHIGALGERRYSSYSFLTSALEGGEWSASRPDRALPPGKEPPVPTVQEAGWAPEPVWTHHMGTVLYMRVDKVHPGKDSGQLWATNVRTL